MNRRASTVCLAALLALAACRRVNPNESRDAGPPASAPARPRQAEKTLQDAHVPGLAWAVVRRGRVAHCEAIGHASLTPAIAATADTLFNAASLAKTIVAIAVMKLVEEGRAGLDDDVAALLPFRVVHPAAGAPPITLRRLLTHTSSIHDRFDLLGRASAEGDPPLALAPFLQSYLAKNETNSFLREPPGTRDEYSNVGLALAALVVESIRKEPFESVARRTIFEPLGMKAAFRTSALTPSRVAIPYRWGASGFEARPLLGRAVYPASDLRASACSLGRLLSAMLGGGALDGARVLGNDAVDSMLAPTTTASGHDVALGWQVVTLDGRTRVGHEGEDDGAAAAMFIDRESGVGAVVLANGDAFANGDATRVRAINQFVAHLLRDE